MIVDTSSADPSNTVEMERELREKHGLYLVDSGLTQYRDHAISDGPFFCLATHLDTSSWLIVDPDAHRRGHVPRGRTG